MRKVLLILAVVALCASCSHKKDDPQPPTEMASGIVVEYGTGKPIEGVQFVHADCKKMAGGYCDDWEYTTPVMTKTDGTLSVPYEHLSGPFSFVHKDYWSNLESAAWAIGPTGSDNLPVIVVHGPEGQRNFQVQLLPVVPVTFHLVNLHLDPDSASSLFVISAHLSGGQTRASLDPFYIPFVTDTTFTLSGYGNVQNEIKVTLNKDQTEVYHKTELFNGRDTVRVEIYY